jgi:hypothetical protein
MKYLIKKKDRVNEQLVMQFNVQLYWGLNEQLADRLLGRQLTRQFYERIYGQLLDQLSRRLKNKIFTSSYEVFN